MSAFERTVIMAFDIASYRIVFHVLYTGHSHSRQSSRTKVPPSAGLPRLFCGILPLPLPRNAELYDIGLHPQCLPG